MDNVDQSAQRLCRHLVGIATLAHGRMCLLLCASFTISSIAVNQETNYAAIALGAVNDPFSVAMQQGALAPSAIY